MAHRDRLCAVDRQRGVACVGRWPAPGEDRLWAWVIVAGAVLSVIGMGLRWAAHIVQNRKIAEDN